MFRIYPFTIRYTSTSGAEELPEIIATFVELSTDINSPAIRELCEEALAFLTDFSTVVTHLTLAHQHGLEQLKKTCLEEIKKYGFRLDNTARQSLMANPGLLLEIFEIIGAYL